MYQSKFHKQFFTEKTSQDINRKCFLQVTGFSHNKHHLWTNFNKIKYKTNQIILRSTQCMTHLYPVNLHLGEGNRIQ